MQSPTQPWIQPNGRYLSVLHSPDLNVTISVWSPHLLCRSNYPAGYPHRPRIHSIPRSLAVRRPQQRFKPNLDPTTNNITTSSIINTSGFHHGNANPRLPLRRLLCQLGHLRPQAPPAGSARREADPRAVRLRQRAARDGRGVPDGLVGRHRHPLGGRQLERRRHQPLRLPEAAQPAQAPQPQPQGAAVHRRLDLQQQL